MGRGEESREIHKRINVLGETQRNSQEDPQSERQESDQYENAENAYGDRQVIFDQDVGRDWKGGASQAYIQ